MRVVAAGMVTIYLMLTMCRPVVWSDYQWLAGVRLGIRAVYAPLNMFLACPGCVEHV